MRRRPISTRLSDQERSYVAAAAEARGEGITVFLRRAAVTQAAEELAGAARDAEELVGDGESAEAET